MRDLPSHFEAWAAYRFFDRIAHALAFWAGGIILLIHLRLLDIALGLLFLGCGPRAWTLFNLPALFFAEMAGGLARRRHPRVSGVFIMMGSMWMATVTLAGVGAIAFWFVHDRNGLLRVGEWAWGYFVAIGVLTHMRDTDDPFSIANSLTTAMSQCFYLGAFTLATFGSLSLAGWGVLFGGFLGLYTLGLFLLGLRRVAHAFRRANRADRSRPADGYL